MMRRLLDGHGPPARRRHRTPPSRGRPRPANSDPASHRLHRPWRRRGRARPAPGRPLRTARTASAASATRSAAADPDRRGRPPPAAPTTAPRTRSRQRPRRAILVEGHRERRGRLRGTCRPPGEAVPKANASESTIGDRPPSRREASARPWCRLALRRLERPSGGHRPAAIVGGYFSIASGEPPGASASGRARTRSRSKRSGRRSATKRRGGAPRPLRPRGTRRVFASTEGSRPEPLQRRAALPRERDGTAKRRSPSVALFTCR